MNYPYGEDDDDIQEYARPCQHCEYHRKRAQLWRDEAYKQAGHPLPEREWVGLAEEEIMQCLDQGYGINMRLDGFARIIEAKLKEKNSG